MSFERFTLGRLFYIPGIVKLWESPGRAGGLLMIIKNIFRGFNTYRENVSVDDTVHEPGTPDTEPETAPVPVTLIVFRS